MIYSDILSYLQVIRRRWWIIAILFGCTMGVLVVSNATSKPVYRAQVRLQVLAAERQEVYLFSQFRSTGIGDEVRAAQSDFVRQLSSPFVAWQTIADLNLAIGASDLLSHLAISTDGDFITLVAEADEPDVAEGIATRQSLNALEQYRKIRSLPVTVLREFITNQLKYEEDQMLTAESAFLSFKREHGFEDYSRELVAYQDMLRNLKQQADQATVQQQELLVRAEKERDEAKRLLGQVGESGAYTAATLKEEAARWEAQASEHEIEAAVQGAAAEEYNKLLAKRQADLQALMDLSANYSALQRGVEAASGNYSFLVSKLNEARLKESQAQNLGFVQIVEAASKPSGPAPSRFNRVAIVGAVVSVLAGVILVFALEFAETTRKRLGGR